MEAKKTRLIKYSRPAADTRTGRVWQIADRLTEESGCRARRRDVLAEVEKEGGNTATASTQYHYWKSSHEAAHAGAQKATRECGDTTMQNLTVAADGRLLIPKEMREAMRLGADGYVTACVSSGELRVVSRDAAIRRMQQEARSLKKPGTSVVDEFLAERRALWGES